MTQPDHAYGLHTVDGLIATNPEKIREIAVTSGRHDRRLEGLIAAAESRGIAVHRLPGGELDRLLPGVRHQGVIATLVPQTTDSFREQDLATFLAGLTGPPFLLILDGVQDPHNLGACLRTADAAGVQAVIVPRDRAAGITPVVRKVACGAAETVPVFTVTNLARTLRELKAAGVWIFGASDNADRILYDTDLSGPLALVLGGEGKGLRRLTRELCDCLVAIPMAGRVESLNVSVAAGVLLFEARRQRGS
jgi:23S rRNA (guanosine2251-2'-O)-methyltransferase